MTEEGEGESREGNQSEKRTPASKRPASSTRRITKEYLDQLKSRLGDNTNATRSSHVYRGVEREDEFAGGIRRAQISWRDVTADGTTVDGPWIPPQIGCGYLEGN